MPSEWSTLALEEICSRIFSGGTPRSTVAEYYVGGDVPWLKTKEVNYRKIYSTESKITQLGLAKSSARLVPVNSVIVAMYGDGNTAGRVAINKIPLTTNQACCNLQVDPLLADYRFVYYALKGKYQELVDLKNGGGQQNLSAQLIKRFSISFPEVNIQTEIANLLESLDDRIDSLQQSNETLEAMARAIFKAWFVDFEPVRAKAEGRQPDGMDEATVTLFPGEFQDSELGPIPQGWSTGVLSDYALLNPESWSKATRPEQIDYVDLANTKWGRIEAITLFSRDEAPSRAQRVLRTGDTIIGTVRPGNGSYALATRDGLTGSTGFAVLRPKEPYLGTFIYLCSTASDNIKSLANLADGGAYPAVRPEVIASKLIVQPTNTIQQKFSDVVSPLLQTIASNEEQSASLADLRDTLLPRLISGKLRVPEAEAMLSEVL